MRPRTVVLLIALAFHLLALPAAAESSTGPDIITFGNYTTSNWRSDDFKGTASRQWDPTGASFRFEWNTTNGDQIGRIGATFGSNLLGVKISDISPGSIMSTDAVFTPATDHWFFWSIYGWTNPTYTYWGTKGWNNEFYIIFNTDRPASSFLADKSETPIGNVTVDGVVFDCYKTPRAVQSQWLAVSRSKTWSSSVDLRKIFDYWRSQGLADEYVVDLGWAVEGFIGSAGTMQLTNIHIPNLNSRGP